MFVFFFFLFFVFFLFVFFFFSSRRRHTRWTGDWSSDVCSSDLIGRERETERLVGRLVARDHSRAAVLVQAKGDHPRRAANGDEERPIRPEEDLPGLAVDLRRRDRKSVV